MLIATLVMMSLELSYALCVQLCYRDSSGATEFSISVFSLLALLPALAAASL
jgi:hypothetical protein